MRTQLLPEKMFHHRSPFPVLPIPKKCLPAAVIQIPKAGELALNSQLGPESNWRFSLWKSQKSHEYTQHTPSEATFIFLSIILVGFCKGASWAQAAYLSHNLLCDWSVRCIQDLPNKQGLESFPYDAGKRTGLQILHQIIAIRSYEEDERQIFVCMLMYLQELTRALEPAGQSWVQISALPLNGYVTTSLV